MIRHSGHKTLIAILITLFLFLIMNRQALTQDVQAGVSAGGALTQVQAKPASNLILGETYYTIIFKTATAGAVKKVEMAFPAGFNLTGAKFIEKEVLGAGALSISGQTLIYTVNAVTPPGIAAGKKIKIMVGGILNNAVTTPQTVTVTTKDTLDVIIDGPTASADPILTQIQNPMIADGAVTGSKIADGTIGNNDVNSAQVQLRVSGTCAVGYSIRAIAADGTVTCELDDTNGTASDVICAGCVGSADIGDGTIGNVDLAAGSYPNITGIGTLGSLSVNGGAGLATTSGNVGIGTAVPVQKLHVAGNYLRVDGAGGEQAYIGGDGSGGDVQIGSLNAAVGNAAFYNVGSGTYMDLYVRALHIMGGADLAEPFKTAGSEEIRPGMVVAIDPEHPELLRVADNAYDKTVAGIVSGANGIRPGVTLLQEGTVADGTIPVALTGRVYAWGDASYSAIEPGDLLTTSDTPGHAMKVTDYARGQGTIIGKAMTALKEGKGLVLVLVSLQ